VTAKTPLNIETPKTKEES